MTSTRARPSFSIRAASRANSSRDLLAASTFALVSCTHLSRCADRLVPARRLLQALVQLADLDVHAPDHLVEAVGFDDGAIDRVLLAFERLGLLRDVSARALSEVSFSSVALLSSCTCMSGPRVFFTSFTASVAAIESSSARAVSRSLA